MKKIGLFGVGHLGKIHAKCITESDRMTLCGIYDIDIDKAKEVANEYNVEAFPSMDELIERCDIADIVTPTITHFEVAKKAVLAKKAIFIEKPVVATVEEAMELIALQKQHGVKIQVGHVERFNPAFLATEKLIKTPLFIEAHRLGFFNTRGNDVSVILDLMIHDLDIVLKITNSKLLDIQASGVAIVTDTIDIANARLHFENGCVANLTASRISLKNMRKMRIFQEGRYISIDFFNKKSEVVHIEDYIDKNNPFAMVLDIGEGKPQKQIVVESPPIVMNNAIRSELESLVYSIENETPTTVTLQDGTNALMAAHEILTKINRQNKIKG
ncbi:MAG TPA: Gfo/Idh/MocA family oxidoreductase [Bacteroidales bacterium]|jgi:predicted dehydrogenase|nr:Gfo/Idh/MocA family oxidoreductase [Bacteroidales bacterium]